MRVTAEKKRPRVVAEVNVGNREAKRPLLQLSLFLWQPPQPQLPPNKQKQGMATSKPAGNQLAHVHTHHWVLKDKHYHTTGHGVGKPAPTLAFECANMQCQRWSFEGRGQNKSQLAWTPAKGRYCNSIVVLQAQHSLTGCGAFSNQGLIMIFHLLEGVIMY